MTAAAVVFALIAAVVFAIAESIINRLGKGDDPAIRAEAFALSLAGAGGFIADVFTAWTPDWLDVSLLALFVVSAWRLWRLSMEVEP